MNRFGPGQRLGVMLALALGASACSPVVEPVMVVPVANVDPVPEVSSRPSRPAAPSLPLVPPGQPEGEALPLAEGAGPSSGHPDLEVAAAQRRLTALRYYAGEVDGTVGPMTTTAVQAFQKVQGLPVDGRLGEATIAALADPVLPGVHVGEADRIDIDLDAQVMYVVLGGVLQRIMPVSSGNGTPYSLPGGIRAESLTPVGTFTIERRMEGTVNAHFGRLYDPMYFFQGWAIHGSGNVPPFPASHGCVRLPRPDADWLAEQVEIGMRVNVYGSLNSFNPAAGETAGTTTPAGDDPGPPPPAPEGPGFG